MTNTATATLTPTTDQTPAVAEISNELSGAQWVARFSGSSSSSELTEPLKGSVDSFIAALTRAGATVIISATFRPPERAYMMHWSWEIINGTNPRSVPPMPGVNIEWVHASEAASTQAARAMVNGFGIQNLQVAPSLTSRHTLGQAIDMSISWGGNLSIVNAKGETVVISSAPRTGMNANLQAVGASYGVVKYVGGDADRPHWSNDGH